MFIENKHTLCQRTFKFVVKSDEKQDKNAQQMKGIANCRCFQLGTSNCFFVYSLILLGLNDLLQCNVKTIEVSKHAFIQPKESLNQENPGLRRSATVGCASAYSTNPQDQFLTSVCVPPMCALYFLFLKLG